MICADAMTREPACCELGDTAADAAKIMEAEPDECHDPESHHLSTRRRSAEGSERDGASPGTAHTGSREDGRLEGIIAQADIATRPQAA